MQPAVCIEIEIGTLFFLFNPEIKEEVKSQTKKKKCNFVKPN